MSSLMRDDDDNIVKVWAPKNWKEKSENELKKMSLQQRSRYLAYEEPSLKVAEATSKVKHRLREAKRQNKNAEGPSEEELLEKEKHEKLIGQLKAAEARNRLRVMRLRYDANRGKEVYHLTMCQPTARKAVRLQALLPNKDERRTIPDKLDKLQRARVEKLLEDKEGLLTSRK